MNRVLSQLLEGRSLSVEQAKALVVWLTRPDADERMKAAILVALQAKGPVAEEVRGAAQGMISEAVEVPLVTDRILVDTAGTGGDGAHSFNVSTATAIVLAGAGLGVVKHGNRSVSSRCGSADVLEAMGVPLATGPAQVQAQMDASGFSFLFAPAFHPATAAVVPVRRALGVRTIFNLLGPLTNPVRPRFQLVGAYSYATCELIAHALADMDVERAYVVHGSPGWDEATPCGPFKLWSVAEGEVRSLDVEPLTSFGIPRCSPMELVGGDVERNALAMSRMLQGRKGAFRDAVLLNAALVLRLAEGIENGREAVARAAEVIDSGAAWNVVEKLRQLVAQGAS